MIRPVRQFNYPLSKDAKAPEQDIFVGCQAPDFETRWVARPKVAPLSFYSKSCENLCSLTVFSSKHRQGRQHDPEEGLEYPARKLPPNRQTALNESSKLIVKMMVKLASDDPTQNDLDRIQDTFPTDNLLLYDKDPLSPRSKLLVRKRSTTASRLQRALSGKNKIVPTEKHGNNNEIIATENAQRVIPQCPRSFIMGSPVQLTTGVQSQERHLFLFNDLLIVAKARASGTFKLKEKIRVAELWLSNCLEVVCEVAKNGDTSFVMGWPTTNVVATFCSTSTRDLWLAKLKHLLVEEQQKGPQATSIRVHYWDPNTKEEYAHNVSVSPKDTVIDCISNSLQQLGLNPNDVNNNQLWVKTDRDSAPYPLIGHESPFAIKMNCLYAALAAAGEDSFDLDYDRSIKATCPVLKCYFILRNTHRGSFDLVPPKKSKRVRKSPILQKVFRRSLSKPESLDTAGTTADTESCLFSQPLSRLVRDGRLPISIMEILQILYEKGPYTVGIFRKSANVRMCREVKDKLNTRENGCGLENVNIFVLAALLKEFLRSLPDCLLLCCLYLEWLAIPSLSTDSQKIQEIKRLLEKLPASHLIFLRHFMCVLWHVQKKESENMMSATNLAVCVGPSLLWPSDSGTPTYSEQSEASKQVPAVVEFLIKRCEKIFGKDCLSLFGALSKMDLSRQDSGNEESDSLHSLQSSQSSVGLRRDDSSIDSLEHALLGEGEPSPKLPSKAKMSLTNLSRDSGLTMSDTQLYTPDEEMDSEASSSADQRHVFHGTLPAGGNPVITRYRGDEWRASSAKTRSISLSSAGGDSACSVDGRPSSQESKRSAIGSPSCLYPSIDIRNRKSPSNNLRLSTSCPPQQDNLGYGTQVQRQRQMQLQQAENSRIAEMNAKPTFPLGDRKDVIKRRLSRSRAWVRPVSAYGAEELSPEPVLLAMRKSASEESILSNFTTDSYLNCKRPVNHNKGKAPSPPPAMRMAPCVVGGRLVRQTYSSFGRNEILGSDSGMLRSKSVHHFPSAADDCLERSRSYGRLEHNGRFQEGTPTSGYGNSGRDASQWRSGRANGPMDTAHDFSYDSSTLSDNDSTPHISRSNSRGKDFGTGSTGSSTNNYSIYTDIYNEATRVVGKASAPPTYEEVLVRQGGTPHTAQDGGAMQPIYNCRARQIYEESVRIYNEQMDSEIHHAAPIRIETSDEEQEPPPLPPKPLSLKRPCGAPPGDRVPTRSGSDETDWQSVVDNRRMNPSINGIPLGAPNVSVISGKRVLTATQNIYDVPPWRPTARTKSRTSPETVATPNSTRSRSATISTSKTSWHRSKSQPSPETRNPHGECLYDYPRPVKHRQNLADRSATMSASSARSNGFFVARNQDCCRHGATVGRTFRRDISWSVSQLKALFSRHKETHPDNVHDSCKSNGVSRNCAKEDDSKAPPPYRMPPRVESKDGAKPCGREAKQPWTTTLKRYRQPSVTKCSSAESQGSTSGGEESYV